MFECVTHERPVKNLRPAMIVSNYDFDLERYGYRFRVQVENPEFCEDTLSDSNGKVLTLYKLGLELADEFTRVLPVRNVRLLFHLVFIEGEFYFDASLNHSVSGAYVTINLLRPDKMTLTQNGDVKFKDVSFPVLGSPLETFLHIVQMLPMIEAHNG